MIVFGERGPRCVPSTASRLSAPFSKRTLETLGHFVMNIHADQPQELRISFCRAANIETQLPSVIRSLKSFVPSRGGVLLR